VRLGIQGFVRPVRLVYSAGVLTTTYCAPRSVFMLQTYPLGVRTRVIWRFDVFQICHHVYLHVQGALYSKSALADAQLHWLGGIHGDLARTRFGDNTFLFLNRTGPLESCRPVAERPFAKSRFFVILVRAT